MVMKLKTSKCYENLKKKKNQMVAKLTNSNCDKTQFVTKLKLWQNLNCDKTKKSKYDKTQTVTKLKKSNCDENSNTQIVT